jgi:protein dpy-30
VCCAATKQESTVVPLLMQGLQTLCKERPEDPVEYLASYLLQHNPNKGGAGDAAGGGAAGGAGAAASDSVQQPGQVGNSRT